MKLCLLPRGRHVQGIVDSTVECFKEHVGGVGILLTEINSRHLAQTTNGTAHRRDTKQTELHVHITCSCIAHIRASI